MDSFRYIFGPVPSRRMGISIGISPIPQKTCNYSCVYCQLGRTNKMTNERKEYFETNAIIQEFKQYLQGNNVSFDVVTIVGEGEPTLFSKLGELIEKLKELTVKPVVVITNAALLSEKVVREQLKKADIVLPSMDAYDEDSFRKINRPIGSINFSEVIDGLIKFSQEYTGELWIETMIMKGLNDDKEALEKLKAQLDKIKYSRIYINFPVRPPAEKWVEQPDKENKKMAEEILGGISIDNLASEGFHSEIKDDYQAILSIIRRHPMNQYEIKSFLHSRGAENPEEIISKLEDDETVEKVDYLSYKTFRLN